MKKCFPRLPLCLHVAHHSVKQWFGDLLITNLCKIDILVSSSAACKFFEFSSPRPTRYICCQGFLSIISTFILWVCLLVNWMATLGSQHDLLSFCRQTCRNCCVGQNNWLVQIGTYRLFTYLLVCGLVWDLRWNWDTFGAFCKEPAQLVWQWLRVLMWFNPCFITIES